MSNAGIAAVFSEAQVFVVDREGTCRMSPRFPDLVGVKPWEWCDEGDRDRVREHFVQACMFREEQESVEALFVYKGQKALVRMHLFPLDDGGGVMCTYRRVFKDVLTPQEHNVLAMIGGGASNSQSAEALGITESTVRSHVASIKRKLGIVLDQGLTQAAQQFGLTGRRS